ncbi:hypothetical protein [Candidatus Accumulibacter sp. ACC003]|uniref:hypothetical protein n=1 Tax=Candidatus Accumulibacter sp. ACC003 TaxID=2823334 RepID=UPI0025BFE5B4|nr:hypothetical protein [Candidatus Accumulibacter sp. ACC003]
MRKMAQFCRGRCETRSSLLGKNGNDPSHFAVWRFFAALVDAAEHPLELSSTAH